MKRCVYAATVTTEPPRDASTGRALAVLGLLALLAGCAPQQVEIQADYPAYTSLAELCDAATLVVTGTPVDTEVRQVDLRADPSGDTPEENPQLGVEGAQPDDLAVVTVTSFKVDDVVAGHAIEAGEVIEVAQMGGELDGVSYEATRLALDEGTAYLLFLEEFDGAPAALLNPTQAGYVVTGSGTLETPTDGSLADEMNGRSVGTDLCG